MKFGGLGGNPSQYRGGSWQNRHNDGGDNLILENIRPWYGGSDDVGHRKLVPRTGRGPFHSSSSIDNSKSTILWKDLLFSKRDDSVYDNSLFHWMIPKQLSVTYGSVSIPQEWRKIFPPVDSYSLLRLWILYGFLEFVYSTDLRIDYFFIELSWDTIYPVNLSTTVLYTNSSESEPKSRKRKFIDKIRKRS